MGVSILVFVQLASVFRSRFLVLITSVSPEDCPPSPLAVDLSAMWAGTTWAGDGVTDGVPVLSTE